MSHSCVNLANLCYVRGKQLSTLHHNAWRQRLAMTVHKPCLEKLIILGHDFQHLWEIDAEGIRILGFVYSQIALESLF